MTNREELIELSNRVFLLLTQYVEIHDTVFKFSIRKALPIPFIFQPIDFGKLHENLTKISEEFKDCLKNIKKHNITLEKNSNPESAFAKQLAAYVIALQLTVQKLLEILKGLHINSLGTTQYSKTAYKQDLEEYQELVNSYAKVGLVLNGTRTKLG